MRQPPMFRMPDALSRGARRLLRSAPRHILLSVVLATTALAGGSTALSASQTEATAAEPLPLEIFQQKEDLLFRVGYRLATANAAFCENARPTAGLLIHDAHSYGNPQAVRQVFGLSGDIGAQSVAPGSPAAATGLRANDTIEAVVGKPIAQNWPRSEPRWKRVFAVRDAIEEALLDGSVAISWRTGDGELRTGEIVGVPACPTRFELVDSKNNAAATGERVLVGENFPGFGYDEESFAAAIAHEMAHNIFRHPQTFNDIGWKRKLVRLSERDADRLMPWLLANAGYDPRAAIRFMQTWGPKHGGWIFRKRTHDGWDERVEFIEAEIARIEAARARSDNGLADWSAEFESELAPELAQRTR